MILYHFFRNISNPKSYQFPLIINGRLFCARASKKQKKSTKYDVYKHLQRVKNDPKKYYFLKEQIDYVESHNLMCDEVASTTLFFKYGKHILVNYVELMEECQIIKTPSNFAKIRELHCMDINSLKKSGIIEQSANLIKNFLSYLEPFPFDENLQIPTLKAIEERIKPSKRHQRHSETDITPWSKEDLTPPRNTIFDLRMFVTKQYTAWRCNCSVTLIDLLLYRYHKDMGLVSVRGYKKTFDILVNDFDVSSLKLLRNFFLLRIPHMRLTAILENHKMIFNTSVKDIFEATPRILSKTADHISNMSAVLKKYGITDAQVRNTPDIFLLSTATVDERLNYIKKNPILDPQWSNDRILFIVIHFKKSKKRLEELSETNLNNLSLQRLCGTEAEYQTYLLEGTSKTKIASDLFQILKNELDISRQEAAAKVFSKLKRHNLRSFVPLLQVKSTLEYLRELQFSNSTILESLEIVLYPKEKISNALEMIAKDDWLASFGFENGFCKEDCKFECGNKNQDKRLVLCVYLIEREVHFTGEGVLAEHVVSLRTSTSSRELMPPFDD